jgi:glyoxylase-like metal-dependent hydrolase (beta-lactamase superfamily II)
MLTNLTRISRFGFVNAYLVTEDDGLTLVDTLIPRSAKVALRAAENLGAPIVRIALTHAHGDHIGSLDELVAALPGVEVLISARDARLMAKDMSLDPGEPQRKLRGSYPGAQTRPTRTFAAGEMVGSLEVVAAPGHTPGHIAFLDERDRTLIAGDAFSTLGGVSSGGRTNPRFPLVGMATWDRATANATAARLAGLAPAALAAGHGPVIADPAPAIQRALAAAGVARAEAA